MAAIALGALFATGTLPPRLEKAEYEDKMQDILDQANKETAAHTADNDPSKSVENAVRYANSAVSTIGHAVDEVEQLHPPRDIEEEHEQVVETWSAMVDLYRRAARNPEAYAEEEGQQEIQRRLEEAGQAESRVREQGHNIGTPFFGE